MSNVQSLVLGPKSTELVSSPSLDLSNQNLGPAEVIVVAGWLSTEAAAGLVRVDISGNSIGSDGGKALISVLPSSSIKSLKIGRSFEISTEKYEETAVDCSKQDFGPGEVIVLSWWLSTEVTAGVAEVDLSGNLISGSVYKPGTYGGKVVETYDTDVSGIEALSTMKVKSLIMRGCEIGPKAITALSSILATAGVETVDLSNNRFDPSLLDGIKHKVKLNLAGCR